MVVPAPSSVAQGQGAPPPNRRNERVLPLRVVTLLEWLFGEESYRLEVRVAVTFHLPAC